MISNSVRAGRPPDEGEWRVGTNDFIVTEATEWAMHAHPDVHEIIWRGERGSVAAETEHGSFAVPSSQGLWIPAGVEHRVMATPGTAFRCTFVAAVGEWPRREATAVAMPRLARDLLDRLEGEPFLRAAERGHAEQLALGLVEPVATISIDVPMPTDGRTRRVADALLADPADDRTIDDWGRLVGSSARNLSRLFEAETGLGFARWRARARMCRAVELLAADVSVVAVGRRVGYRTPSAFVQAFRREVGRTPGAFAAQAAEPGNSAGSRHGLAGRRHAATGD